MNSGSFAAKPEAEPRVQVRIEGPFAFVTVERSFFVGDMAPRSRSQLAVFDVALPTSAVGFAVDVVDSAGESPWVAETADENAPISALALKAPWDPAARHRVIVQGLGDQQRVRLRYRFALPMTCDAGQWTLSFPGAVDLSPVAYEVDVRVRMPTAVRVVAVEVAGESVMLDPKLRTAKGRAPAQAAWDLRVRVASGRRTGEQSASAMGLRFRAKKTALPAAEWWALCRAATSPSLAPPREVVFAIDMSRSVGAVGLALQRDFVRAILETLPTGTRWNAVLFHRKAWPLFPVFRLITSESLAQLDDALVPGSLQNGSALTTALATAATMLRWDSAETERLPGPASAWLVVVSDGSLPESKPLVAPQAPPWAALAAVLLRPEAEETPSAEAQRLFLQLAAQQVGVFRTLQPPGVTAAATALVAEVLSGGDWFSVRAQPGGPAMAGPVPPGRGTGHWVAPGARRPSRLELVAGGISRRLPIAKLNAAAPWPASDPVPVLANPLVPGQRAFVVPLAAGDAPLPAGGELERSVLRNALALAYLPRARACYLNRSGQTLGDRDLAGRVRLRLQLERGEVLEAQVVSSTLQRPAIETCLSEAAFALHIPRPAGRDAPVEALLNLVFKPATTQEAEKNGPMGPLDREIEVLVAPLRSGETPAFDRLLLDEAPVAP